MRASTIVAVIFLFLVSLAHLLRLIFQVQILANTYEIPMWMSLAAFIFTAALAIWLWMDNRKRGN
jgi:hypothetical protein